MRILIVEDEQNLADALAQGLQHEGFAVDVAYDGEQGLWLATEEPYDAIILDVMLPKMNGFLVCRTLRDREIWTPVLMLTAKDGEWDEAEGLDTGADDYMTKPFSLVVLLARLRSLLRRSSTPRPTSMRVGDLTLNPASKLVTRGETQVPLTSREFAILELLMARAGDVLSKTDILSKVWDFAFDGDVNIVEVYVSSLRKKIDTPFGAQTIRTVRGHGYCIDPDPSAAVDSAPQVLSQPGSATSADGSQDDSNDSAAGEPTSSRSTSATTAGSALPNGAESAVDAKAEATALRRARRRQRRAARSDRR